jgi:hypothetical protein
MQRVGVIERGGDAARELFFSAGQCAQTSLARDKIARRRIDQHLLEPVRREPRRNLRGRKVVAEPEFDRTKTVARRGGETIQERKLGVQKRQIGAETRHRGLLSHIGHHGAAGAMTTQWLAPSDGLIDVNASPHGAHYAAHKRLMDNALP